MASEPMICLVHNQIQKTPASLDYRHLHEHGIMVLCRLNWGYADGTGTLPKPSDRDAFIDAIIETISTAKGVDVFTVGNEPNNRQEWPGFNTPSEYELTPEYTTAIYNEIRANTVAPLAPPPLDPYFGPGSNNMDWWLDFMEHTTDVDALFLHLKTQTNDPHEVWSEAKFSDPPLQWQYLHLRAGEPYIATIPDRYARKPIFVTECNPQHLETIGGPVGWKPGNAEWIHQAAAYFRYLANTGVPITGVAFYRYEKAGDQAPFGLSDKPTILEAIWEA